MANFSLSSSKRIPNHFDFNEHVWFEILKRSPVIALGRIRCVCKSLNSLITSSFFVSNHVSKNIVPCSSSYPSDKQQTYIIFTHVTNGKRFFSYSHYNPQEPHKLKRRTLPFQTQADTTFMVKGVIHGVVCMSREAGLQGATSSAILWNPTIRKYLTTAQVPRVRSAVVGFGFDARTNDFKVVAHVDRSSSFDVFSTGVGRWRSVACDIRDVSLISRSGCFRNGSIHWLMRRGPGGFMELLVFDCEKEEFKTMAVPQGFNKVGRRFEFPSVFVAHCTGMLALYGYSEDMWVMQEYGVWKKLTRDQEFDFVFVLENGELVRIGVERTGEISLTKIGHGGSIKRSLQIIDGYVFEPSLFFMDGATWRDSIRVEDV